MQRTRARCFVPPGTMSIPCQAFPLINFHNKPCGLPACNSARQFVGIWGPTGSASPAGLTAGPHARSRKSPDVWQSHNCANTPLAQHEPGCPYMFLVFPPSGDPFLTITALLKNHKFAVLLFSHSLPSHHPRSHRLHLSVAAMVWSRRAAVLLRRCTCAWRGALLRRTSQVRC